MSRRLKEDEVDRIRGRAGLDLVTLYLGVLFAIAATIWLATLIVDSARNGDAFVVVVMVLFAMVGWTIMIALVRHARGRRRVSTRTAVRRVSGILTSTGGRHATFRVGDTDVWWPEKSQAFTLTGAWIAVDVLEDGEVIDVVASDRNKRPRSERRRKKKRKQR